MLVSRVITGLSLIIILALLLFKANFILFNLFLYLVVFLCSKEWGKVNKLKYFCLLFNISLIIFTVLLLLFQYNILSFSGFSNDLSYFITLNINLAPFWGLIFISILYFSKPIKSKLFLYFTGFFILTNFVVSILDIKYNLSNQSSYEYINFLNYSVFDSYQGAVILLSLVFLTAINDTGAYFTGKFYGRHKLAKFISPNKTIEGLFGGVTFSLILSTVFYYFLFNLKIGILYWLLLIFVLMICANLGDLVESQLKRNAKVKDSGNILPGHGGMLDRLDSHLVVIPMFWFFMINFVF